ncbi:MAG: hypothetical protein ACK4UO_09100 [Pseudolabrys sp.]
MTLFSLSLLLAPAGAAFADAPKLSDAGRAWIATCVEQLKAERGTRDSKQRYCACMHENFDDNRAVTQTEMERTYPPLHRACQEEAGRRQ